ncbi:MAG TPA: hypothetical protein VJA86_04375 [Candidatus Nanoarchaeia archaeon]|nr:hypothetical protein [Candidatus Nanoarchaeia archaeon]
MMKMAAAIKTIKCKKAEMGIFFKILLWAIVFAVLAAGIYFLTKNLWS